MYDQNPGDVFEENVASAAQTLSLLRHITGRPDSVTTSAGSPDAYLITSSVGAVRLEQSSENLILDIVPHTRIGIPLQDHSFRFEARTFAGSPIFDENALLLREGLNCLTQTITNLGNTPSLVYYNDGRMKHGILARLITNEETVMDEFQHLIEEGCQAIAAMLPEGRALHRRSAAFGALPKLSVINEQDLTVLEHAGHASFVGMRLARIEPYLSMLPEAMFLRPDADNPNTVVVQPTAMIYAPPEDRAKAIVRLSSIMIRLGIIAANIRG